MMTAMRVPGDEKGEGGKAMAMAARVADKRTAKATKRAMAMKIREAGEEEGNCKSGKSNGDGKEKGHGEEDSFGFFSFNF